jgi:hypothetical protein
VSSRCVHYGILARCVRQCEAAEKGGYYDVCAERCRSAAMLIAAFTGCWTPSTGAHRPNEELRGGAGGCPGHGVIISRPRDGGQVAARRHRALDANQNYLWCSQ